MAATFSKVQLSGSPGNGRGVKVAATATAGTLIHTASATAGVIDEVWLYVVNTDTSSRKLTIELGGTTAPDDLIEVTVPAEAGLMVVVPGLPLSGGVVVRAFAAAANVLIIHGYVNRITP
jgi:hypothetical protein